MAKTGKAVDEFCREEYKDYLIYSALARREKDPERAAILSKLAEHEKKHYHFWRRLGGRCGSVSSTLIALIILLRTVLGLTFTLKLLERGEEETIKRYREFAENLSGHDREELEQIIREEEEHEKLLVGQINESVVKYLGFIVLGFADAIVEITGVHAGFLGVTSSTLMAGVAGLVVGFAAAISMSSAAYLQAKQENVGRSPVVSALVTGAAYIAAVVLLALPYFILHDMIEAFIASILVGVALIAGFNYYASILFDRSFLREFGESTALMLGTAIATYLFGDILGSAFGLQGVFG